MTIPSLNLKIVFLLTIGFVLASIFGYLSHRIKLTPILGYLIAGYLIGPYSPGFVADREVSLQLAEIGVVLMMFGVGLHFKIRDLVQVKNVAIPGSVVQTALTAAVGLLLVHFMGWSIKAGIIFGFALGVASTVVLIRILTSKNLLHTPVGHICMGWLIMEDILSILLVLLLPALASTSGTSLLWEEVVTAMGGALIKFLALVIIMFTAGQKIIKYAFTKIVATHSHELFTLGILAFTFLIATGASILFGTSIALGAFIAGMVIGKTDVRHQVSVNATPLKDTFSVLFFLAIGMLFNPCTLVNHFLLFIAVLAIILIIKPLSAFLITSLLGHPLKTGLTIAIAIAQIGEFSFILAEQGMRLNIFPLIGYDIIIACSLVSISLNPLLFKTLKFIK